MDVRFSWSGLGVKGLELRVWDAGYGFCEHVVWGSGLWI
jgi:hypothetical protein